MVNYSYINSRFWRLVNKPEVKNYINLSFTLLTIILLSIFALKPALVTLAELNLKLTTAKERTEQLDKKIDQLTNAQLSYEQIRPDLEVVNQALPEKPNLADFVKKLNQTASSTSLQLSNFKANDVPFEASQSAKLESNMVSFRVSGPMTNIQVFLSKLESLPRVVTVNSFALSSADNNSSLYDADLAVSIYNQK